MELPPLVPETSASANSATSAAACASSPTFGYGRHERNQHKPVASRVNQPVYGGRFAGCADFRRALLPRLKRVSGGKEILRTPLRQQRHLRGTRPG